MKFDKEKDELLIESVKGNSVLYDAADKHYKSPIFKHKTWENISEAINIPVADCKKRWKHLRDHYLRKKKAEGGTGEERNTNTWDYMSQLSFLSLAPHQQDTSVQDEDAQEESVDVFAEVYIEQVKEESQDLSSPVTTITDVSQASTSRAKDKTSKKRKRKDISVTDNLEKRQRESILMKKLLSPLTPQSNHIKKFFDSMGDIVMGFPPNIAAQTRLKVCQIVTEMELKVHNERQMLTAEHSRNPNADII